MSDIIRIVNNSATKLLFSSFKAGDNGAPADFMWISPNSSGELKTAGFSSLSVGVQAQKGGRWIGGDPKDPPYTHAGGTFTLSIARKIS